MPITCVCSNCQSQYALEDALAGKKVRCKTCSAVIAVPAAPGDPADNRGTVITAYGTYRTTNFETTTGQNSNFQPVHLDDQPGDYAAPSEFDVLDADPVPTSQTALTCPVCQSKLERGAVTCAKCRYSFVRAKALKRTGEVKGRSNLSPKEAAELSLWWKIWFRWDFALGGLGLLFSALALMGGTPGGHGTLVLVTGAVCFAIVLWAIGGFMLLKVMIDEGAYVYFALAMVQVALRCILYLMLGFPDLRVPWLFTTLMTCHAGVAVVNIVYYVWFLITRWSEMKRGFLTFLIGSFIYGVALLAEISNKVDIWHDWFK